MEGAYLGYAATVDQREGATRSRPSSGLDLLAQRGAKLVAHAGKRNLAFAVLAFAVALALEGGRHP